MKEIQFKKQRVTTETKVCNEIIKNFVASTGQNESDFMIDTSTVRLEAHIYEMMRKEKEITLSTDRPTFFDWLFCRRKTHKIKVNCKELLGGDIKPNLDCNYLAYSIEK